MNMTIVKVIFIIAAVYDGVLGFLFLFWPGLAFEVFEVVPPNHMGYVQFPAVLLMIFAAMFYRVATDPLGNRILMIYGVGLKTAYCGLVFYYMLTSGVPDMWVPWAWADAVFIVAFLMCWSFTGKSGDAESAGT
ncbi:MAG: hypothetical protein GWM88_14130 [Pseudomonadales bacterium]|nr:hypothetical protein [Pseudomonadales bacterium]NIX09079.1 hypothetical protein [Pseudomonadales bacterium]